jgi:hypothetical protein
MKKLFRVTKFYHYAEMYDVEAENEKQAIEKLDEGLLSGEFDDPDDIYQEFDFDEAYEVKE